MILPIQLEKSTAVNGGAKEVIRMNKGNEIEKNPMLEAALQALELDLRVIPLQPNGTDSLLEDWDMFMFIKPTKEDVIDWFRKWPTANIGVVCGLPFGIVVVETNCDNGPPSALERGLRSPCVVRTRNKLYHYYRSTDGIRTSYGELPRGMTVYGYGDYTLLPPSRVDGISYDYIQGSLGDARLSEPPLSLSKKLKSIERKERKRIAEEQRLKFKETDLFPF